MIVPFIYIRFEVFLSTPYIRFSEVDISLFRCGQHVCWKQHLNFGFQNSHGKRYQKIPSFRKR